MSKAEATAPYADIVAEAGRLLDAAQSNDVPIRLIGGLAVYFHTEEIPPPLSRSYDDIDLATTKGSSRSAAELLTALGYEPSREFNALNGSRRLLFFDTHNERKLDVFVDTFELCHTIPITARLALDERTIPLAELLLTKLQVVELTEKDLRDIVTLLQRHVVGTNDDDTINGDFIAALTADDWGLWRTVKLNVERIHEQIDSLTLDDGTKGRALERMDTLWERIEREPKSRKWRMRDRVGDRKRWYEIPDEV
ncbi:MAG: hypothetical protein JWM06_2896 [Actinomycetia bacterium]|nr:hypothetical protein [Actinomycetes bacterium]